MITPIGFEYTKFNFSAGETQVKITSVMEKSQYGIKFNYESDAEIFELLLVADAFKRLTSKSLSLDMPYMPYSRQDRACASGESFSLSVFADIILSADFRRIYTRDPHSEVTKQLLPYYEDNEFYYYLHKMINGKNVLCVAPDAGATQRVKRFCKTYQIPDMAQATKIRDSNNGKILDYKFNAVTEGYDIILVIDDICDGGATFLKLAEKINHPNKWLFVTHGIFSKGIEELSKHYTKIISTDSFKKIDGVEYI
jgi:ribose-phosphate pyrophosphokinase